MSATAAFSLATHPDAREVYRQALRFELARGLLVDVSVNAVAREHKSSVLLPEKAGRRLRVSRAMSNDAPWPLIPPALVCGALSVELGLKCVLRIEGKAIIKTHDLKNIFQAIGPEWRKRIESFYQKEFDSDDWRTEREGGAIVPDLATTLAKQSGIFVEWRYVFQGTPPDYALDCPQRAIMRAIDSVYPDWYNDRTQMRRLASPF